jgi:DNA helicase-2/ATP-dependent DNA helicase PcrA
VHQVERLIGGTTFFSQDSGRVSSDDSAQCTFGDIAVLYRLNAQRAALEEAFARSGIPYRVSGKQALGAHALIADTITLLRLIANRTALPGAALRLVHRMQSEQYGQISMSVRKKWNSDGHVMIDIGTLTGSSDAQPLADEIESLRAALHERGLCQVLDILSSLPPWQKEILSDDTSRESWRRLMQLARIHTQLDSLIDYISLQRSDDVSPARAEKVALSTLHAAKGLEFGIVFIAGCEQRLLPLDIAGMRSDRDEERRLFYVGMTRAKHTLYLLRSHKRALYGAKYLTAVSPFVADIEESLKQYDTAQRTERKKEEAEAEQLTLF